MGFRGIMGMLCLGVVLGCARPRPPAPPARPCDPVVQAQPNDRVFRGFAEGPRNVETRQTAMVRTLSEALQPLGVQVSSALESTEIVTNEGDSGKVILREKVSMKPVEVRELRVGHCYDSAAGSARTAIAIPDHEWKRLKRVFRGGTLLVLDCKTRPEGACRDEFFDEMTAAASEAGLKVNSAIAKPQALQKSSARDMISLGEKEEAAYVLWVSLSGEFRGEVDGVLYAYANASVSLIETSDGQVEQSEAEKDVKGAHYAEIQKMRYGPEAALEVSLKKAMVSLRERMVRWQSQSN